MIEPSRLVAHRPQAGPTNPFREFSLQDVEQTIPDRFAQHVAAHPDRLAVKARNGALTYAELNRAANEVAWAVIGHRGGGQEPVAILFEHGAPFITASLGVLKTGRIQVPLESTFPRARLRYVLEQSQASVLVTNTTNLALARELRAPAVINIDEHDPGRSTPDPALILRPDAEVAIAYTSGSTGQPKGIVWNHRVVLHAIMRHTNTYRVCMHDRIVAFRASLRPYLYALLNGATYYPVVFQEESPAGLAGWMAREKITVYRSAVSMFRSFAGGLSGTEHFPCLRLILVFGEPVYPADVELYRRRFAGRCTFATSLGCKEFDDYACCFIDGDTPLTGGRVPGGALMAGTEVQLLDGDGRPVGVDEIGEIVIRSRYNAVGYWRRADLTQAAFLPDPDDRAGSLYRTGDLGRRGRDGRLSHAGRKDFQVKVRGHRVEVAEVEAALLGFGGVKAAAVVGREESPGETRLVAYLVSADPNPPAAGVLRRFLRETLPDFMVPSSFVLLDALPLTATGKVDRRALPLPDGTRRSLDTPFVAPATPLEHQLQQIWEHALGVRPIGTTDNFFDLGGHSVLAAKLMQATEAATGRRLPVSALVEGATIQRQAQALREHPAGAGAPVIAFHGNGSQPPFFFLHGDYDGGGLYCRNLAQALGPEQPLFAVHPHGFDGRPLPGTIETMAADHLATVRAIQPHGPYRLGGLCNGGVIAFEMARRLHAQGEQVAFLGLLDASAKNAGIESRLLRWFVDSLGTIRGLTPQERLTRFLGLQQRTRALMARARHYWHRLPQICRLSRDDRLAILRRKATRSREALAGVVLRRRTSAMPVDAPTPGSPETGRVGQGWSVSFDELYRLAIAGYVPGRYPGTITLFRSGSYQRQPPDLGWRVVAPRVEIHDVQGDHLTSITRHVHILGERLRACLQKT